MIRDAYLFAALRTPRGRGRENGALHPVTPVQLLVTLLCALQLRYNLNSAEIDDTVLGCVMPVGEQGADIARTAVLAAGWAVTTPGVQLNRFCASGLDAVNQAAMQVRAGWANLVVAGGIESMSRIPIGADGGALLQDPTVSRQIGYVPQGISADLLATNEGFSRRALDEYALLSQRRAAHAIQRGYFNQSIVPVCDAQGNVLLAQDEHVRPDTTAEKLAALPPAFQRLGETGYDAIALRKYNHLERIQHLHTAGNSSGMVDGAALVLVGDKEKGQTLGLRPRARIRAAALVGSEPTIMLTGPTPATHKALRQAGMTLADIDLIEVNEAFAAVVLKTMRDLGIAHLDQINVNGGAIALGHPLGATGAMLLGTALDELERRDQETALITLCAAGGMGIATIIERV